MSPKNFLNTAVKKELNETAKIYSLRSNEMMSKPAPARMFLIFKVFNQFFWRNGETVPSTFRLRLVN